MTLPHQAAGSPRRVPEVAEKVSRCGPPGRVSLAALLVVLVVVVAAVLAAIGGLGLWRSYGDTKAGIQTRAVSAAYVVSAHIQWIVSSSQQALRQVDETIGDDISNPSEAARASIRDIVLGLPGNVSAQVIDLGGTTTFSTRAGNANLPFANYAFFQELKAGRPGSISRMIVDPSSQAQMFVVARRVERNGAFAGVVAITVPATVMSDFWEKLALGPGSTVSVLRSDGGLVARFPPPDGPINLSNYVLFTDYLKTADHGVYDAVSPVDGVIRIVGYTTVDNEPLVAIASLSTEDVFAQFWNRSLREIATLVALLVILLLFGLWLVRLLHRDNHNRALLVAAAAQNQRLLQEIHHRVKNNLQAVAALVRLQPLPTDVKAATENRIGAMVAIHEQAYRSQEYAEVSVSEHLLRLIANLQEIYGKNVVVETDLTAVTVSQDVALPLGLIANEVLSNALKHAFPEGRAGRILVSLKAIEANRAELRIVDDGVGYVPEHANIGIGSRLIDGFVQQIGGHSEISLDGGTNFVLRFSLSGNP